MSQQEPASPSPDANGSPGGPRNKTEAQQVSARVQKILQELGSAAQRIIDLSYVEMELNEAQLVGEAIASSQHLEVLVLQLDPVHEPDEEESDDEDHSWPNDTVLRTAFLGPRPNTSVRSLIIEGSGTDGDFMRLGVLPQVIRENSNLTKLEFQWKGVDGTGRRETLELFDSLISNTTLRTLVLPSFERWDYPDPEDGGFIDADTFSRVVKLVESNTTISHLDLHIGECRGPGSADLNLPAFYAALRSNSSIRIIRLRGYFLKRNAEAEFLDWIRTSATLEELDIESLGEWAQDEDEEPLRYELFFRALRENKSLKKLVLDGSSADSDSDFRELMDALTVNSTLQEVVFEPDSDHGEAVREALQRRVAQ
ncbi:hypothetical protein MPTK1_6g02030 [Marchantia polymorpha subsp. ruderalis]|uniref:Uncharacterized protein n=2 Tax=Marchantia polymorpha TaxID=3197 RepID=A0AAF6BMM0_MARPO|nr:hypothetical protein MARPO_0052s0002 [Marchantia polymorpha]BBN13251.1 hypothetical protein Mp_6g02030 [Marchantia polymorpha subsp. ruderalis]PTQ38192.1 hypothetical protein MARPO_0052s0002 [Marchantia polymorpha]PTQ38193.1 hypothetical protein MARPO_0052s0002 [Marchantia polymorpha]PTQ38194.1 hypothetical protein MARPO_0052s0002 [Marchantia polymorpha]|eukprot:PTQ38191.1 hypothetical protein MARPO_0052s0002 [Marchantia polymorpha]